MFSLASITIQLLTITSINVFTSGTRKHHYNDMPISDHDRALISGPQTPTRTRRSDKPNIILIITDDLDSELGSMSFMPKTLKILRDGGAHFNNAFVTTPMCCPSRSSMLTGMYAHNHNVYTNNDNCSSPMWQRTHETRNFGTYLANAGYRTGYFGKYLNEYNGSYIPPGWSEWVGLVKNTRFYNYTLNFNGKKIKHGDNYYMDYFTDLIANDSVTFLKKSKQYFPNRPVAMVLSMPAPHGPEDAAPQYQHMFNNVTTHRTPSWNYAPNPDKQWLLQYTPKMEPIHIKFTDMLHQKRLQTLQSVDDAVEKVYNELKNIGELDNTYIVFTSDHGYHLGQFGLVKGKAMPYETDIRVPFYLRGPKAPAGVRISNIVLNLDLAPTILDMAGISVPDHMDGRSILKVLDTASEGVKNGVAKKRKAWRDSFLVERGKVTEKKIQLRKKNEAEMNDLTPKDKRLQLECQRPEYEEPCKGKQRWACHRNPVTGKFNMYKCRAEIKTIIKGTKRCHCWPKNSKAVQRRERTMQKKFLRSHVYKAQSYKLKFLRHKRSLYDSIYRSTDLDSEKLKTRHRRSSDSAVATSEGNKCRVLNNNTVVCGKKLYYSMDASQIQKEKLDKLIKEYRARLEKLREIQRLFKNNKPFEMDVVEETTMQTSTSPFTTVITTVKTSPSPANNSLTLPDIDGMECSCEPLMADSSNSITKRQLIIERRRERREKKKERRAKRRQKRRRQKKNNIACNSPSMKCFKKDNNPPFWHSSGIRKGRKGRSRKDLNCWTEGVACHLMVNEHWRTPPKWTYGPFCFCPNSNNNTYWCVRTINDTHNFLYCEFVTGFISFYDMTSDPYQLRNAVFDLDFGTLQKLHELLNKLRACKGGKECTIRARPTEKGGFNGKRRRRSKKSSYQTEVESSGENYKSPEVDSRKDRFLALTKKFRLDDRQHG